MAGAQGLAARSDTPRRVGVSAPVAMMMAMAPAVMMMSTPAVGLRGDRQHESREQRGENDLAHVEILSVLPSCDGMREIATAPLNRE